MDPGLSRAGFFREGRTVTVDRGGEDLTAVGAAEREKRGVGTETGRYANRPGAAAASRAVGCVAGRHRHDRIGRRLRPSRR